MLPDRLKLVNLGSPFNQLQGLSCDPLPDKKLAGVSFLHLCEGAKLHIISQINCKKLVVTVDNLAARATYNKLSSYEDQKCAYLPAKDEVLVPRRNLSSANDVERIAGLSKFCNGDIDTLVISVESLFQRFPKQELVKKYSVSLSVNDEIEPNELARRLGVAGYVRQEVVGDPGEFAQRGDIFDICTIDDVVYRIGFFDDLVEEIRVLDKTNITTVDHVDSILVYPTSDYLFDENGLELARTELLKHKDIDKALDVLSMLNLGANRTNIVWGLPYFKESTVNILEYFLNNNPSLVIFDEPKLIYDKLEILNKEFNSRIKS